MNLIYVKINKIKVFMNKHKNNSTNTEGSFLA